MIYSDIDFIDYEILTKISNEIQVYKMNSNFNIYRQDILTIFPNYWKIMEQSFFDDNGNETYVELLTPTVISFAVDTSSYISKSQYKSNDKTLLTTTIFRKSIGVEHAIYNGHEIKCLRSEVTEIFEYSSLECPFEKKRVENRGYLLSGENIGVFYTSFVIMGDTLETVLIDTMTIEEFEREKSEVF